jgi:hypothetical protein
MEGFISFRRRVRQPNRQRKSQFRHGQRAAVMRAITGASILLGLPVRASSQARAAELVGSNIRYVEAAVWVLQAEHPALLADVLAGRKSLLEVAAKVRGRANLIKAYRRATLGDPAAFGSTVGADRVFDETIVPAL